LELNLIKLIKSNIEALPAIVSGGSLITSIGDDCAEFSPPAGFDLLFTTDTMIEGVHFRLSYHSPVSLGRKLVSVNVSDIAAMAGSPKIALLNLEVPPRLSDSSMSFWPLLIRGIVERLREFGAILVGGDTVKAGGNRLGLTLTLVGAVKKGQAVYRKGAKIGDQIYCSGFVGESALGLKILEKRRIQLPLPVKRHLINRHLNPEPRFRLSQILADCGVTAMIDVSDGIATDLAHLCEESGVRANIIKNRIPVSRAVRIASSVLGIDAVSVSLCGGEDYELLWTIPQSRAQEMEKKVARAMHQRPYRIGWIENGKGVWLKDGEKSIDVTFKGYEH